MLITPAFSICQERSTKQSHFLSLNTPNIWLVALTLLNHGNMQRPTMARRDSLIGGTMGKRLQYQDW